MRHFTDLVQSLCGRSPRAGISTGWNRRIACAALVLVGLACAPLFAQQPATISGFLADSSGAAVPNASSDSHQSRTPPPQMATKSDSSGNFAFPGRPRARHLLDFRSGRRVLAPSEQKDIVVTSGERRSVGTISLAVGTRQRFGDRAGRRHSGANRERGTFGQPGHTRNLSAAGPRT